MKVAITGGNGHIGSAIIEELIRRNYKIKALANTNKDFLLSKGIELVEGSIHDQHAVSNLLSGCDYLIHCAAIISIDGDPHGHVRKTNVEGVKNLLEVAQSKPLKRIIHVSSIHALDQLPIDEKLDENRRFVSDQAIEYDKSKRDGQLVVNEFVKAGLPIITVLPTAVYGPPNHAKCKQNSAFISMSKGKLPVVFHGGFNWVDVRDVAQSICNALHQGQIGENYILGGHYYTLKEQSKIVGTVVNKSLICVAVPIKLVKAFIPFIKTYYKITKKPASVTKESIEVLEFSNKHISSEKAIKELNHQMRSMEESIKDLLIWEKENAKK